MKQKDDMLVGTEMDDVDFEELIVAYNDLYTEYCDDKNFILCETISLEIRRLCSGFLFNVKI